MGTPVFTISGDINVDSSKANRSIDNITNKGQQSTGKLNNIFQKTGQFIGKALNIKPGSGISSWAAKTGSQITRLREVTNNSSRGGFGLGLGISAGMTALTTLTGGIGSMISQTADASDAMQKFQSTMQFAGISGEPLKKASAAAKKYADDTVYDLQTITNTTAQLAANGIKNYTELTQAAGNVNAVAGGNADTFKSVAMVLTQTAGAGKLTTENWNQLSDAIPGASGKLQEAMKQNGAYTGNFRDAMQNGQISADEFNKALTQLGNTDVAKKAATSTSTFEGAIGNLQASVVTKLNNVIDKIGKKNLTDMIGALSDFIGKAFAIIGQLINFLIAHKAQITAVIDDIKNAIQIAWDVVQSVFNFIQQNWSIFEPILIALGILIGVIATVTGVITVLSGAFAILTSPLTIIVAVIALVVAAIMHWGSIVTWVKGVWSDMVNNIQILWSSLVLWFNIQIANFQIRWNAFWTGVSQVVSAIWNGIKAVFTAVIGAITAYIQLEINGWKLIITTVMNVIKSVISVVWNGIKAVISAVLNTVRSIVSSAWNGIYSTVSSIVNRVKNTISSVFNSIKGIVSGVFNAVKSTISGVFGGAVDIVRGIVDHIKSLFNFHISFPEIHIPKFKLPHFSVSGGFDLKEWAKGKGFPSLNVDWFAKGGILDGPTIFGMNGSSPMVGGEAGREAVVPLNRDTLGQIGDGIAATMDKATEKAVEFVQNITMPAYETPREMQRQARQQFERVFKPA